VPHTWGDRPCWDGRGRVCRCRGGCPRGRRHRPAKPPQFSHLAELLPISPPRRIVYEKDGVQAIARCQGKDAPDLPYSSSCDATPCASFYFK
jgi:hypothetical protein